MLDHDALRLEGMTGDGLVSRRRIEYEEIRGVRIGRTPTERLNGRPTLVLERASAPPLQLGVLGAGMLFELSDVLAWVASLANQLGLSLEQAAARYANGCPKCHAAPCRC